MHATMARPSRTAQVDRERADLRPVAGRGDVTVAGGDRDALLAASDGVDVVDGQAGVGAASGAPGPQVDALGAAGPRPFDDERIAGRQAGVKADHRLVDPAADADGAHAVAERMQARPPGGPRSRAAARYDDAIGAGAVDRELPALGRCIDDPGAGALLRRHVADQRPELEG